MTRGSGATPEEAQPANTKEGVANYRATLFRHTLLLLRFL